MTDPLELCRARIQRAGEHIDSLSHEIASVAANYAEPRPPARLCLMVGEIVYHLRAALDHVVWALAVRNGKSTKGHIAFPVCENPEQFKHLVNNGILKGIPRKYYPQIASFQPYLTADPPNAILKLLDDLATDDLGDIGNIILTATPAGEPSDQDGGALALCFVSVGSFENAPVLPVLGYLRNGVEAITQSFEKYLPAGG